MDFFSPVTSFSGKFGSIVDGHLQPVFHVHYSLLIFYVALKVLLNVLGAFFNKRFKIKMLKNVKYVKWQ